MDSSFVSQNREKLSWAAAGSAVIGIVLVVFFAFSMWIEYTPGRTETSSVGVWDGADGTRTETRSRYVSGDIYYYWVSIDSFPYTLPIGAAALLLGVAGLTAARAANQRRYDAAQLRRASNFAFAAVGIGIVGAIFFLLSMWWEEYGDYWLDTGFYGLVSAGTTAAVLLRLLARTPQADG